MGIQWVEAPKAEYNAWYNMVQRCHNPRHRAFVWYGARGIEVCESWRDDFLQFLSDMRPRPSPEHSLDRIDNDGNYTPENCRWATRSVQQRNRTMVLDARGTIRIKDRWRAAITINGQPIVLGTFATKAEASRVYRQAAVQALLTTELVTAALTPLLRQHRGAEGGIDLTGEARQTAGPTLPSLPDQT